MAYMLDMSPLTLLILNKSIVFRRCALRLSSSSAVYSWSLIWCTGERLMVFSIFLGLPLFLEEALALETESGLFVFWILLPFWLGLPFVCFSSFIIILCKDKTKSSKSRGVSQFHLWRRPYATLHCSRA